MYRPIWTNCGLASKIIWIIIQLHPCGGAPIEEEEHT